MSETWENTVRYLDGNARRCPSMLDGKRCQLVEHHDNSAGATPHQFPAPPTPPTGMEAAKAAVMSGYIGEPHWVDALIAAVRAEQDATHGAGRADREADCENPWIRVWA